MSYFSHGAGGLGKRVGRVAQDTHPGGLLIIGHGVHLVCSIYRVIDQATRLLPPS